MTQNQSIAQRKAWKEGRNKGFTGQHHDKKTKLKISKNQTGKNNSFSGKSHTEEYKHKISVAFKGKGRSLETRRKMSLSQLGNHKSLGVSHKKSLDRHRKAVLEEIKKYKRQGFRVLDTDKIHPDFIARIGNKDKFYAVEVEFQKPLTSDYCVHKYDGVDIFNDIHWIKRDRNMKF